MTRTRSMLIIGTVILLFGGFMALFGALYFGPTGTSYFPNFIGIVLMLLGIVVVVRGYSQHPKVVVQ
jgi:hypothetical protein